jgi:transcriptional regulator with GAF, ATPase, and Fis domain
MVPEDSNVLRLQSTLEELKSINRVLDRICKVRETNHIMSIIIDELVHLTGAKEGIINLVSANRDESLVTVVRRGQSQSKDAPFKVDDQLTGWVLRHGRTLKVDDLDTDDRFSGLTSENGRLKSILCCPMVARGETIGLTTLVSDLAGGPFGDDLTRLAGIIVSQSAQLLSNALLLEELARKNELLELSQRKLHDENIRLHSELGASFSFDNIVGRSPALKNVLTLASKVAGNDSPLLIMGPTGTGKELIAKAIHYSSGRGNKPFIVKNCGIKTESLLEAELFGYVKGAFTGADRDKPGLFKEANGGSVFLDEIGDAPPGTQVAILRVIETGEIRPVGANRTEYVDVRIISATNKDLREEIKKGGFREDLFYRISTFTIDLPPLSHRREDIPLLVHYFLKKLRIKLGNEGLSITPEALELLTRYSWPGNIRQLENELERASVVCTGEEMIDIADLSPEIVGASFTHSDTGACHGLLKDAVERVERELIGSTLKQNRGNILKSSKLLGLTRKGLKDKMARYGIEVESAD